MRRSIPIVSISIVTIAWVVTLSGLTILAGERIDQRVYKWVVASEEILPQPLEGITHDRTITDKVVAERLGSESPAAPLEYRLGWLLIAILVAAGLGTLPWYRIPHGAAFFWCAYLVVAASAVALGIAGSSASRMPWSWFLQTLGAAFAAGFSFLMAHNARMHHRLAVTDQLSRFIPRSDAWSLALRSDAATALRAHKTMAILSVETSGLSLITETLPEADARREFRETVQTVKELLHRFGGMVTSHGSDRTTAVFGWESGTSGTPLPRSVERALQCAAQLQQLWAAESQSRMERSMPIYGLKIGIAAERAFIENIGESIGPFATFDLAAYGHGVSLAEHLRDVCEDYRFLVSATAKDYLNPAATAGLGLKRRMIQIRHHRELTEAWECDPFHDRRDTLQRLARAHYRSLGLQRRETRWPLEAHREKKITVQTPFGRGNLSNFSLSGIGVILPIYLAKGVELGIELGETNSKGAATSATSWSSGLRKELAARGIGALAGEVRWARPEGDEFLHGIEIKGLAKSQREQLVAVLRDLLP